MELNVRQSSRRDEAKGVATGKRQALPVDLDLRLRELVRNASPTALSVYGDSNLLSTLIRSAWSTWPKGTEVRAWLSGVSKAKLARE